MDIWTKTSSTCGSEQLSEKKAFLDNLIFIFLERLKTGHYPQLSEVQFIYSNDVDKAIYTNISLNLWVLQM